MLILDSKQVEYCQVVGKVSGEQQTLSGLTYQGNTFIKVKSYNQEELEIAIKECREKYLDNEDEQIPTLIIKDKTQVSLWKQDNNFTPLSSTESEEEIKDINNPNKSSIADKFNLKELVTKMRTKDGLIIKARHYKLKLYQRCFLGNEAVDWLVKNLKITRTEAVEVGQKLINDKIIHHVVDEHPFQDEPLFYRFYEDEGKSVWTDRVT
jgi:hypothetical protein